jgi:ferredoxin
MSFSLKRMPWQQLMTPEWKLQMERIRDCEDCGHCRKHCPYGLDTPALLKRMLADYEAFYNEHAAR